MYNGYLPKYVDHINGIRDDNRIENLREATNQQNNFNSGSKEGSSSQYKGVSWHKRGKKWVARYSLNGKQTHLGLFETEIEAYKAYSEATKKYHKDYQYK